MPFSFFDGDPFHTRTLYRTASRPRSRPGVRRVDLGRALGGSARALLEDALARAATRHADDLDVMDLLGAAAGHGTTGRLLLLAGADLDRLRARLAGPLPYGAEPGEVPVTVTPAAMGALQYALEVSRALGDREVRAEHLLLGLAAGPSSRATRLLVDSGLSPDRLGDILAL